MAVNVDFDYFSLHSGGGYVSQWSFELCGLTFVCGQTWYGPLALRLELVGLSSVASLDICDYPTIA